MKKSDLPGRREHVRFETALPAELAMARLHDLLPRQVWGLQRQPLYRVSSEKLHDTIYFEVREYVKERRAEQPYTRIITGQIREVDARRCYVDCTLRGAFRIPMYMFGFALAVEGIIFLLLTQGGLESREFVASGALIPLTIVFAALSSNRKATRDPALGHIERAIQPREEDRNLIARRRNRQTTATSP